MSRANVSDNCVVGCKVCYTTGSLTGILHFVVDYEWNTRALELDKVVFDRGEQYKGFGNTKEDDDRGIRDSWYLFKDMARRMLRYKNMGHLVELGWDPPPEMLEREWYDPWGMRYGELQTPNVLGGGYQQPSWPLAWCSKFNEGWCSFCSEPLGIAVQCMRLSKEHVLRLVVRDRGMSVRVRQERGTKEVNKMVHCHLRCARIAQKRDARGISSFHWLEMVPPRYAGQVWVLETFDVATTIQKVHKVLSGGGVRTLNSFRAVTLVVTSMIRLMQLLKIRRCEARLT